MDDIFLKFQKFNPSERVRMYVNNILTEIVDESPYGAHLNADITKQNHYFKGSIFIHSSAGNFYAIATEKNFKVLFKKLVDQIKKQLNRWKSMRFNRDSIKKLEFKISNDEKIYEFNKNNDIHL